MSDWKLRLYYNAPSYLRSLFATAQGFHLRNWRYGSETESLIAEYLEHESWSEVQWKEWQDEKLAYLLHRAATQVPFYREQWIKRRQQGDRASWDYLDNWPTLSKEAVRRTPNLFVAEDCDIRKMYHEHTSGTTGKSLDLWWSRETVRKWYALFETRCRYWNGVSRHDRWAIFGGQLVTQVTQRQPPFWVWNAALNQLYMSSYHLAPDLIPSYLDALKNYDIKYLWGYSSALYILATEVLRQEYSDINLSVVLTNAEPLYDYQRDTIAKAFSCAVKETYGMAEIVAAASECPEGNMHIWPEVGKIELANENINHSDNTARSLICTGLLNTDMPLIRYEVGDQGTLLHSDDICRCGRLLPQLQDIEGRVDDILYTSDGRKVGRLDPIFKSNLQVIEAQIIQESLENIVIRFIPANGFQSTDRNLIIENVQARLGNVQVNLEPVSQLPIEENGKFRAVISKISPANLPSENSK